MITIGKITYTIVEQKTADDCEAAGLLNYARAMRQANAARDLVLTRPNSSKIYTVVEYANGTFSKVSFAGYM